MNTRQLEQALQLIQQQVAILQKQLQQQQQQLQAAQQQVQANAAPQAHEFGLNPAAAIAMAFIDYSTAAVMKVQTLATVASNDKFDLDQGELHIFLEELRRKTIKQGCSGSILMYFLSLSIMAQSLGATNLITCTNTTS